MAAYTMTARARVAARYQDKVAREYEAKYARLLVSMSLQQAKGILGFPPNANPSPEEVSKAYKAKAFEHHPDRGGDAQKMVEVNVAKDLLTGKGRPQPDNSWSAGPYKRDPREEPSKREPPKVVKTIPGVDFHAAVSKSGIPSSVEWKCISKPSYASKKDARAWYSDVWTLIGVTDQKIWVLSVKRRSPNLYFEPDLGGNVVLDADWQANLVSMPSGKDPLKTLPKLVRSPSVLFEDGTIADPPKKWVLWESGTLSEAGVRKVKSGSGGANLKDVLAMVGIVSAEAAGVSGRKSVVELTPKYSLEKGKRIRLEQGGKLYAYQSFDYEVRVNGKTEMLSDDTVRNLDKNGFIMAVFNYDPPDGRPKQLHKVRGSRLLGASAGVVIRLLADSLTTEASWLHIALEKAAEEWEMEDAKTP